MKFGNLFAYLGAICLVSLPLAGLFGAEPEAEKIAREENRTQRIGEQTSSVAREIDKIVADLERNRLLTSDENKDFVAARDGMDEIAQKEIRSVLEELVAARQALERAKRVEHLRRTVAAQEKLIARLAEELVRIQYRSQLRYLIEQMRAIVAEQRQAVRTTQNAAIELAAAGSDDLRSEIHDRVVQAQDAIRHDWTLVSEQVAVMLKRYGDRPFFETINRFAAKARSLAIEQHLAETRRHLVEGRFGLAVSGQRLLADYYLELLKILESSGLSPAEQRSALENLVEKTEDALRRQQDLLAQTETLGRDLTQPLREELSQTENRLAEFVRDLSREAEQIAAPSRNESSPQQEAPAENRSPRASSEPSPRQEAASRPSLANEPSQAENPWAQAQQQTEQPVAGEFEPSSPEGSQLYRAADSMSRAADNLSQGDTRAATRSQRESVNHLAQALASMRERLEGQARNDRLENLQALLGDQAEMFDQISRLIAEQRNLIAQTAEAAGAPSPNNGSPPQGGENAQARPGESAQSQGEQSPSQPSGTPLPQGGQETAAPEAAQNAGHPSTGDAEKSASQEASGESPGSTARSSETSGKGESRQSPAPSQSGQDRPPGAPQGAESQAGAPTESPQTRPEAPSGQASSAEGQAPAEQTPGTRAASPLELARAQEALGDRTEEFSNEIAPATEARRALAEATGQMDQAASQLASNRPTEAMPHQQEALRSLRAAQRRLAQSLADAVQDEEAMAWLGQIGNIDQALAEIEQMAGEAEAMPPQPVPDLARRAAQVADQLGQTAVMPPIGPSMAAQIQSGARDMQAAAQHLEQGRTDHAARTLRRTAAALGSVRSRMAAQVAAALARAGQAAQSRQAAAQAAQAAQSRAAAQSNLAAAAAAPQTQPTAQSATRPGPGGHGRGMRGLGPTDYEVRRQLEKALESGAWSRLPERQREEILQALKDRYPVQYERALIRYFRNLSRLEAEK